MAVDREFAYPLFVCTYFVMCCSSLGVFERPFPVLGPFLNSIWVTLGSPWPLWAAVVCRGGRLGLPETIWKVCTQMRRPIPS